MTSPTTSLPLCALLKEVFTLDYGVLLRVNCRQKLYHFSNSNICRFELYSKRYADCIHKLRVELPT